MSASRPGPTGQAPTPPVRRVFGFSSHGHANLLAFEAQLSSAAVLPALAAPPATPLSIELHRADAPTVAATGATSDDFVGDLKKIYRRLVTLRGDDDLQPRSPLREKSVEARFEDATSVVVDSARKKLFGVLPVALDLCADAAVRRRIPRSPSDAHTGVTLHVVPVRLEFAAFQTTADGGALPGGSGLPQEPLWCTFSLWHFGLSGKGVRVSEEVWFHVASPHTLRLLPESLRSVPAKQSALFNIAVPRPELHLVLCIFRVASPAELDEAAEPYLRGSMPDKARGRWLADVDDACARFGHLRSPLACAATPLFSDNGELIGGNQSTSLAIGPILKWRAGADLCATLSLKGLRKSKPFAGAQLTCQRTLVSDEAAAALVANKTAVSVRVLAPPPLGQRPHCDDVSLLFLHPLSVDLSATSGKNIVAEVRFADTDAHALPLPATAATRDVFFAPITGARTDRFRTAVLYHDKRPSFVDQVKLALPWPLPPDAHLVVTFFHVPLSKKKDRKDNEALETPLGCAVLPLVTGGAVVLPRTDALLALPVASSAAPGYLARFRELTIDVGADDASTPVPASGGADVRWLEGGKPLFQLRTLLLSSTVPMGAALETVLGLGYAVRGDAATPLGSVAPLPLLRAERAEPSLEACELALAAVPELDPATALAWLPHLVHRLLAVVCAPVASDSMRRVAFARLLTVGQSALWQSRPKRTDVRALGLAGAAALDEDNDEGDDQDAAAAVAAASGEDVLTDLRRVSEEPLQLPLVRRLSAGPGSSSSAPAGGPQLEVDARERDLRFDERAWKLHSTRTHVLHQFAWHVFDTEHVPGAGAAGGVHEALAAAFVATLRSGGGGGVDSDDSGGSRVVDLALDHANFVFDLIFKSLVQHTPRQARQRSSAWNDSVQRLLARFGRQLVALAADDDREALGFRATVAVGIFARRCLGAMDRGVVLHAVELFLAEMSPESLLRTSPAFVRCAQWRLLFLRAVCATRHVVGLSVPLPLLIDRPVGEVVDGFAGRHFLAALLLHLLAHALQTRVATLAAIGSLVQLLWRHDHDARCDTPMRAALVASLYFPLLPLVLDNFAAIGQLERRERALWFAALLWVLRNMDALLLQQWLLRETQTRRKRLFEVLLVTTDFFDHRTSLSTDAQADAPEAASTTAPPPRALLSRMHRKSVRTLLTSAVRSLTPPSPGGSATLGAIAKAASASSRLGTAAAPASPATSSPAGSSSSSSSAAPTSPGDDSVFARPDRLVRRSSVPANSPPIQSVEALHEHYAAALARFERGTQQDTGAARRSTTFVSAQPTRAPRRGAHIVRDAEAAPLDWAPVAVTKAVTRAITSEVCWIAVDVCTAFVERFQRSLRNACDAGDSDLFERVFAVLINVLRRARRGALPALHAHAWPRLRSAVERFRATLFGRPNSVCGDLCEELLSQCCGAEDDAEDAEATRVAARDALAFMFEQNVATVGNAARTRLQTTIAAAHMLGRSETARQPLPLLQSLRELAERAATLPPTHAERAVLVQETSELHTTIVALVRDTSTLAAARLSDAEAAADLLLSVSREMFRAPDLRVAWLLNLADFQLEARAFEEAAQAKIACAALVAAYLKLLGRFGDDVLSRDDVRRLCPNIDEELRHMPDERTLATLKDDICQSKTFSEDGFVLLLESAVALLKQGGLHESAVASYGILVPLLTRRGHFGQLSAAHSDLATLCNRVVDAASHNETMRQFARFYRVAFFGKAFGALDGAEFVYKEGSFCRLMDFTDRLKRQFAHVPALELLDNSLKARDNLVASRAYMQIVAVEPFLDADELARRPTTFERNFNLRRFVFETPFTPGGRAQGELKEQWKRKSVLTLEAAFPHMRKRLRVVKIDETDCSPVECAIELLQRKVRSLKAELSSAAPQSKVLQMELQGSLLTQVNVGPLAICETFLAPAAKAQLEPRLADALFDTMCELERTLGAAVKLNADLVTADQVELQAALEDGLRVFKAGVAKYASDTDGLIAVLQSSSAAADLDSSELLRQRQRVDAIAAARHRVVVAAARAAAAVHAPTTTAAANRELLQAREHLRQLEHAGELDASHGTLRREPAARAAPQHATPPPTTQPQLQSSPQRAAAPPSETDAKMRAIKTSLAAVLEQVSGAIVQTEALVKDQRTPPAELLRLGRNFQSVRPAVEEAAAALGVALPQPPPAPAAATSEAKLHWLVQLLEHSIAELRAVIAALHRAALEASDANQIMALTVHVKSLHAFV